MPPNVEIDRALAAVTAAINDQRLDRFDRGRVQAILIEALGGQPRLTVDDGGGLHDELGARVGVVRRTPSGEWITERQNEAADRSDTAVLTPPPRSKLRKLLTRLKVSR
jgi:hypothetical protein